MHENKKIYRKSTDTPSLPIDESLAAIDPLDLPLLKERDVMADVLRLDKIHPVISGNKWFKLKFYLLDALRQNCTAILTFGGPYSNHILASACAAHAAGLHSIGIIRGEEPPRLSPTLLAARQYGMHLEFVSREEYKNKTDAAWLGRLALRYPEALLIPEGGAGPQGLKGSADILSLADTALYSHIACATGTGTTLAGIASAAAPHQQLLGLSVLKGPVTDAPPPFLPVVGYHFGGYAKKSGGLLRFMNEWYRQTGIPTDFVYTAKLFAGIVDMIRQDRFPPGSRILLLHTGGLQGNCSLPPGALSFSGPDFV